LIKAPQEKSALITGYSHGIADDIVILFIKEEK